MDDVIFTCQRCGAQGNPPACAHFAQPWSREQIAEAHTILSGREYCPRCGSGPRQREDAIECPDCGYRWSGPPLVT